MSYDAFKVVHLAGVVIFLGNIIVTAMWKVLADRTGDPRIIAYAQRLVTITDWIFTAGGVALIVLGAYGMVFTAGLDPTVLARFGPIAVCRFGGDLDRNPDPDPDRSGPSGSRVRSRWFDPRHLLAP